MKTATDLSLADLWVGLGELRGENSTLAQAAYRNSSERRRAGEPSTYQRYFATDVLHRVVQDLSTTKDVMNKLTTEPNFLGSIVARALDSGAAYLEECIEKVIDNGNPDCWIKRAFGPRINREAAALKTA